MKALKRLLCGVLLVLTLILSACIPGVKKNGNISSETIWHIMDEIANTKGFVYFMEDTMYDDPNDSDYEIGFAYESNVSLEQRARSNFSPKVYRTLSYHKMRRNKETKEVDKTFLLIEQKTVDGGTTGDPNAYDLHAFTCSEGRVISKTYSISTCGNVAYYIDIYELFQLLDFDIYLLNPQKVIKNGNEYSYKVKSSLECKSETMYNVSYCDFMLVMPDGSSYFFLTDKTINHLNK